MTQLVYSGQVCRWSPLPGPNAQPAIGLNRNLAAVPNLVVPSVPVLAYAETDPLERVAYGEIN